MDRHHRRALSKGPAQSVLVSRRRDAGDPARTGKPADLTAISSFRPFRECPVTADRTKLANLSWRTAFSGICYLSTYEPSLDHPGTRFIANEQFPRIVDMLEVAASIPGWSVILNADIVIRGDMGRVMAAVERMKTLCAISRRYEFRDVSFKDAKVVDLGLDFFMAQQEVWARILEEYPYRYRFGHSSWDALMLGAFNCIGKERCFDLTKHRFVFHPRHGERRTAFFIDDTAQTRFRDSVFLPRKTPH